MARSYIVAIIGVVLMCVYAEDLYNDRYDDIDVNSILQNTKLRNQYYNCFIGRGPCLTADARFFRETLGDSVLTKCKRCTEKQKVLLDTITDWYTTNRPDEWNAFIAKTIEDLRKKNAQ